MGVPSRLELDLPQFDRRLLRGDCRPSAPAGVANYRVELQEPTQSRLRTNQFSKTKWQSRDSPHSVENLLGLCPGSRRFCRLRSCSLSEAGARTLVATRSICQPAFVWTVAFYRGVLEGRPVTLARLQRGPVPFGGGGEHLSRLAVPVKTFVSSRGPHRPACATNRQAPRAAAARGAPPFGGGRRHLSRFRGTVKTFSLRASLSEPPRRQAGDDQEPCEETPGRFARFRDGGSLFRATPASSVDFGAVLGPLRATRGPRSRERLGSVGLPRATSRRHPLFAARAHRWELVGRVPRGAATGSFPPTQDDRRTGLLARCAVEPHREREAQSTDRDLEVKQGRSICFEPGIRADSCHRFARRDDQELIVATARQRPET